jgi:predicted nucleotidyltransferase
MNLEGRKELFRALVGSHNYNLNRPESDKDYKVFVAPTFDDLYFGKRFKTMEVGVEADFDVHDIRQVSNLLWKANVNFVEILFSKEIVINPEISEGLKRLLRELFIMKNKLSTMNLPYLYNACVGMHHEKMSNLIKGTEGTKHLVEQFGYDTKQALHAFRILDFLRRFESNGFKNFQQAIWYPDDDIFRRFLFNVKDGKFTMKQVQEMATNVLQDVEHYYKESYRSQEPNDGLNNVLISLVKEIVRVGMMTE